MFELNDGTTMEESIDDYIQGNFSFLSIKNNDKNFYHEKLANFPLFSNSEFVEFIKTFNLKSLTHFLENHPEIKSLNDFYKHGLLRNGFREALSESQISNIRFVQNKYKLTNLEFNELLDSLSVVFILHEFVNFIKSSYIDKVQKIFNQLKFILSIAKKLEINPNKDSPEKHFFSFDIIPLLRYKTPVNVLSSLIKRPNHRHTNTSLNYFCYMADDLAKRKHIKNNLADFTLPLIKDFKLIFPDQFEEIIKFDSVYILKKIAEGQKLKTLDDIERTELLSQNTTQCTY